jgi:hypothetical protein
VEARRIEAKLKGECRRLSGVVFGFVLHRLSTAQLCPTLKSVSPRLDLRRCVLPYRVCKFTVVRSAGRVGPHRYRAPASAWVEDCSESLGAPVPATLPEDPAVEKLVTFVRNRVLAAAATPTPESELIPFCLGIFQSQRHRLRYLLGHFAPSRAEYQALQLPPAFYFLYYFLRPLRLIARYTLKLPGVYRRRPPFCGSILPLRGPNEANRQLESSHLWHQARCEVAFQYGCPLARTRPRPRGFGSGEPARAGQSRLASGDSASAVRASGEQDQGVLLPSAWKPHAAKP